MMGEELKEIKPEVLKGLKVEFVAFEGKIEFSKLINKKAQEAIKNKFGSELMVPLVVLSYGENKFIIMLYGSSKDYLEGKATIISDKPENVKEFYDAISKILISMQE